jgi:type VI secretion system protein ImpL
MPPDFTLLRVLGPQAGAVFTRASGAPLERGVPGTYTYAGYHEIFAKKLPELVLTAQEEDAWVMNTHKTMGLDALRNKALDVAARAAEVAPLMEDIRRRYLLDYARHWSSFLEDIRPITGNTLAFDVGVVRQFAGADSPLLRLARAAVRETTLSRPIDTTPADEKSYLARANEALNKQADEVKKNLGLRAEIRTERQLVDSQFSALREVVTGQADASLTGTPMPGMAPRIGSENIMALLNEFYTMLVVAETAVANNSTPPASNDVAAKLRLESDKLPAPFKEVLASMANSGAEQVMQGTAGILRGQATVQFERLMGLLALHVSEPCKRAIDGRYPFAASAASAAEVNVDDFNALFSSGGTADEYFSKYLGPFVDTSLRPWRYKNPATAHLIAGASAEAFGTAAPPPATGPTLGGELLKLLAQSGPNPESFARMAQIREVFFREQGAKRMAWKLDMRVQELDASINELVINIDGQSQRYAHGPVQPMSLSWPGPRGGAVAELTAQPRIRTDTSRLVASGPWGLMRLLDKGRTVDTATPGRATVEFAFDGRKAVLEWSSAGPFNPLTTDLLRGFQCPSRV